MTAKVFLSLSFVDQDFVSDVYSRLPKGLAYFYKESFENGENLIAAMERTVNDASVFILFASKEGLASRAVNFEIDQARAKKIFSSNMRVLIFPTSKDVSFKELPEWLQSCWVPNAGMMAADVARYITHTLLDPDIGVSNGAPSVVGRGKTLDKLEQITADLLSRTGAMPQIYMLAGFTGIGRRTFTQYFMRRALSAKANLPYGPVLTLSPQADLMDVYRALRSEISTNISPEKMSEELQYFATQDLKFQVSETVRLLRHFEELGQAVVLVSVSGYFEDRGEPKEWVQELLKNIPEKLLLFMVSNRQFDSEYVEGLRA